MSVVYEEIGKRQRNIENILQKIHITHVGIGMISFFREIAKLLTELMPLFYDFHKYKNLF